jgi:hypothetical protein
LPLQVYVTPTLARHDPRSSHVFDDQIRALPQIIAADKVADETGYMLLQVRARVLNGDLAGDFHRWHPGFTHSLRSRRS